MKREINVNGIGPLLTALFNHRQIINVDRPSTSFDIILDGIVNRSYFAPEIRLLMGAELLDQSVVIGEAVEALQNIGIYADMDLPEVLTILCVHPNVNICSDMDVTGAAIQQFCNEVELSLGITERSSRSPQGVRKITY